MKNVMVKFLKLMTVVVLMMAICSGVIWPAWKSYAAKGDLMAVGAKEKENIVYLDLGKAKIININGDVSDVLVADPSIVDIIAVQSNKLYLVGAEVGDTNLIVLNSQGEKIEEIHLHVRLDLLVIQTYVDETFPDEDIRISMLQDQMIMSGTVSTPEVAQLAKRLIGVYYMEVIDEEGSIDEWVTDLMKVQGEQQVMLRVRILEVTRSVLKELGPETAVITDDGGLFGENIATDFVRSVGAGSGGGLQEPGFGEIGVLSSVGAFGPIAIVFEALVDDGLANLLAEPNLTAISGEQAGFLAGGEFPVPTGRDSEGNVIISYRNFGVSLNFLPTVFSEDRIVLQLQTEVSSLNRTESLTISGLEVPGLDVRRASTVVEMGSGQSLMIAGLLQSKAVQSMANIPGIKDAPVIGDLLKSESFTRAETELVVVVSPFVVKPFANKQYAKNEKPIKAGSPLTQAFARNVRRTYGVRAEVALADDFDGYGYILD